MPFSVRITSYNVCYTKLLRKKIENIKIRRRDLRVQVPVNLESDAVGAVIQSLGRRAKYLLINLSNNKTIIWHLGMSGRIGIHSEKPVELLKHDHVILETDDGISRITSYNVCYTKLLRGDGS